jgi:hypothetical protein
LFNRGRELLEAGDTAQACDKFAESERLDPSSGTVLNLARCHELLGRSASAWAEYLLAARLARSQGRTAMAEEATLRAKELEPKLSYLTVQVVQRVRGLEVTLGGTQLDTTVLGTEIPMDPGVHVVVVRAPGFEPRSEDVNVLPSGDRKIVTIPALTPSKPAAAASATETAIHGEIKKQPKAPPDDGPRPPAGGSGSPWTIALGGAGVAALGAGVAFGFVAASKNEEARTLCGGRTVDCPHASIEKRNSAEVSANVGNVVGIVGIVNLGVAAYLFLKPGSAPRRAPAFGVRWDLRTRADAVHLSVLGELP